LLTLAFAEFLWAGRAQLYDLSGLDASPSSTMLDLRCSKPATADPSALDYEAGVLMIRFFGSHADYDKIDAETI
jgi:hypothetical protein